MPGETTRRTNTVVVLLLLLSATTGLVDAVSVLSLGKVFTANMTGNIVFLGFALAGAPKFSWPLYVVALLTFACGAFVAGALARSQAPRYRRWLLLVATLEASLLAVAGFVGLLAAPVSTEGATLPVLLMIGLTAASMGIRNATVRAMKVPDLTTTVLTLTITGLFADLNTGGAVVPGRRLAAVAAILIGAVSGALLLHFGPAAPLFVAAVIVLGGTILLADKEPPHDGRQANAAGVNPAPPSSPGRTGERPAQVGEGLLG